MRDRTNDGLGGKFVLCLWLGALVACSGPGPNEPAGGTDTAAATDEATAVDTGADTGMDTGSGVDTGTGTADPGAGMKKRTVGTASPPKQYAGKGKQKETLNPKDAEGHSIKTAPDGSCYVLVTTETKGPSKNPADDVPSHKPVDCPEAMMDAAWDSCFDGTLNSYSDGTCVCYGTGTPPPPAMAAVCPKK